MIIYVEDRKITAYNSSLSKEEEQKEINQNGAIKYGGNFNFDEQKTGFERQLFFENGEVKAEYKPISEVEHAQSDVEKMQANQLAVMEALADIAEMLIGK